MWRNSSTPYAWKPSAISCSRDLSFLGFSLTRRRHNASFIIINMSGHGFSQSDCKFSKNILNIWHIFRIICKKSTTTSFNIVLLSQKRFGSLLIVVDVSEAKSYILRTSAQPVIPIRNPSEPDIVLKIHDTIH